MSKQIGISRAILGFILLLFCFSPSLFAQSEVAPDIPETGKIMPEFELNRVKFFSKNKVTNADFKGKWLILDFWFTGCSVCIKSFPKMDTIQQAFQDQLQVLLVGTNGKETFGKGIELLYDKLRKKQNLELSIAYDSVLCKKWDIYSMPHLVIVDPAGRVKAITDGRDISKAKIKDLLDGKNVSFYNGNAFVTLPTLEKYTGNTDVIYTAALAKWKGEKQQVPDLDLQTTYYKGKPLTISMIPLQSLYNLAYFGKWLFFETDSLYRTTYPYPVLEIKNKSAFVFDYTHEVGKGTYNYILSLPDTNTTKQEIMRIMQVDLKRAFNYQASVEERELDVWTLIAAPGAEKKLRTRSKVFSFSDESAAGGAGGFTLKKGSVETLFQFVKKYASSNDLPFFNETGIDYLIDINMDVLMTDKQEIRKGLQKYGLDLVRSKRKMRAVVIRDVALNESK